MAVTRSFLTALLLGAIVNANPSIFKRDSTSSTTTTPTAGLIQTTISGTLTTVTMGTNTATTTTATTSSQSEIDSAPSSAPSNSNEAPSQCNNSIDQPICSPAEGQTLQVGDSYFCRFFMTGTINMS
jgi:hypothetical protein